MKVGLYAVYDSASGVYDGPVPQQSDASAMRNFRNMVGNDQSPIGRNPEDFSLVRVGRWNDATAEVKPEEKKTLITGNEAVFELKNSESYGGTEA